MPTMHTIEEHEAQQVKPYIDASIQNLSTVISKNGAKNLLPNKFTTDTADGVTFTVNSNGSISTSGTASGNSAEIRLQNIALPKGDYILTGCPSGGSDDTFFISVLSDTSQYYAYDYGEGVKISVNSKISYLGIKFRNGQNAANKTFYPMLRLASDTDPTYEPYAKTNQQLTQETTGLIDNQNVNGAVNMLPNTATTQVINGVTFTVNDDGTVTANGTATAATRLAICTPTTLLNLIKKYKRLKITGCPSGGSSSSYDIYFQLDGTYPSDRGDGIIITGTENSTSTTGVTVQIRTGATVSNVVFKPMISVASLNLSYDDYVPYAKSNKELTEDVEALTTVSEDTTTITGISLTKIGRIVQLIFTGSFNIESGKNNTIGTLPSAYRPKTEIKGLLCTEDATPKLTNVRIQAGGNIVVNGWQASGTGLTLRGVFTYISAS